MVSALMLLERNWFILFAALYFITFYLIGKRISFAVIGVLLLYIISGSKNLTLYPTMIWLVGDGTAGLAGSALGKQKLPWHDQKTITGSIAFFLSSFIVILTLLITTIEALYRQLFILSTMSCLVACFVESLPVSFIHDRKPDDNLIVLISTGLTFWGFSKFLGLESLLWKIDEFLIP
jgi:dolichol kinase